MKKVKGETILTVVKSIKVNHQKRSEYNSILSDKAREFLQQRILSAAWYPFEEYKECFDALCLIEGKNDPKTLTGWGEMEGKRTFSSVYQSSVIKGDIQFAVERYTRFHRRAMNFGDIVPEFISDNEVKFTYTNMPREWEIWYHSAIGWAKAFIGMCLDKEVKYEYLNKSWKNDGWTVVKYYWNS